jgi:hypothetical protein
MGMIDPQEVLGLLKEWQADSGAWRQDATENRDVYNGTFVVPLPELDDNEKVAVANLLAQGLDGMAMRTTSVAPSPVYFPDRIGFKEHDRTARERRAVTKELWELNDVQSKRRRRARWWFGYGNAPVALYPDGKSGLPRWRLLDPLRTYAEPCTDPDDMVPPRVIYDYERSASWLKREYPDAYSRLRKAKEATKFQMVEYNSAEEILLFVVGSGIPAYDQGRPYEILHRYENITETPWCVIPSRIGLDVVKGQFDGMVGMYQLQAKLMALYVIAVQRGIFQDLWLENQTPLEPAQVITHADGMRGVVGKTQGGRINAVQMNPGVLTPSLLDRLEYAERQESGTPPEFGGQSGTNIRTGRRGDSVLSAAIDFRIQEAQEVFSKSQEREDKIAIKIMKAYSGRRTFSMYSKGLGEITFKPNELFTSDRHEVRYPYAGADANTLDLRLAQKIGTETLSHMSAMELDPMIDDAEGEMDRIRAERIDAAFMAMIMGMVQDPASPLLPSDVAKMTRLVKQDKMEVEEAFEEVHTEAQERQAEAAQAAPQMPGMPADPNAQPGLDAAMSERMGSIASPDTDLQNLNFMLGNIRNSARPVGAPQ